MSQFTPLSEKIAKHQEEERRLNTRFGVGAGITLVTAVLVVSGWWGYRSGLLSPSRWEFLQPQQGSADGVEQEVSSGQATQPPEPAEPTQPEQEGSAVEPFSREVLLVQVLNGSGTEGKAAELSEALKGLGYSNVEAGDAAYSSYTVLNLAVKGGNSELAQFVKDDLAKVYPDVQVDALDDLAEDSEFDALVIVGAF